MFSVISNVISNIFKNSPNVETKSNESSNQSKTTSSFFNGWKWNNTNESAASSSTTPETIKNSVSIPYEKSYESNLRKIASVFFDWINTPSPASNKATPIQE